ncbi:NADP-dependent phosphogluconate dehydrogenase [Bauldia sp.]|uniref:NADP-dependent phosphogluconate dehydrogenase n=1 Tax=Bauldia sp. TaxID=2575872 RepID=UPI003BAD89E7
MADIGLVGLGVMGANLALNMAEKGYSVAVYNRTTEKTDAFVANAGSLAEKLTPCRTLTALAEAVDPPKPVVIMVKAGEAVDQQAEILADHLSDGDILIDAGNANFRDTRRRVRVYAERNIDFLGVGVSGGEEGARHGPSVMAGGDPKAWARVEAIFTAISAKFQGEPCAALVGPEGAGHFVKTIHNGIEYADMQMIAEIYGIMRDGLGLPAEEMAGIFEAWNGGPLQSYLIEITADVLGTADPKTGKPIVDVILDTAGQKGTGRWSVIEAQDLGAPATVIEAAVAARNLSSRKEQRVADEALFGPAPRKMDGALGGRDGAMVVLEEAMLAGKIAAYAQGFAVMDKASEAFEWNLPLGTVAKIWRAGCIIRSSFLDDIAKTYESDGAVGNLMTAEPFTGMLKATQASLRRVVAEASLKGIPVPALSSALAYFDFSRTARSTADLTQAQRDFFGAHGFERIDEPGKEAHGPWSGTS